MRDIAFTFTVVSLLNPGLFIIAYKWRLVEFYEINRKSWMPERCEFCLFFWMSALEALFYFGHYYHFGWILIPVGIVFAICSAVISKNLV